MKKSLILSFGFFLLVFSTGCYNEDTELKKGIDVPATVVEENGDDVVVNTGNGKVTERANCNCTITSTNQLIAKVSICGSTVGATGCPHCASAAANYLQTLNLSPSSGFAVVMDEPFRVNNLSGSTVQYNVTCGGSPSGGITFTLAPGAFADFDTNNSCDLTTCP